MGSLRRPGRESEAALTKTSVLRGARRLGTGARLVIVGVLLLAARAPAVASDANSPVEYLDDQTGVTVIAVARPLVFAHEHARPNGGPAPAYSDPPRDYVTLAAAAVDRAGKYTYVLIAYFWSVGVAQPWENTRLAREPLVLQLQDRRIELAPLAASARDAGITVSVHPPPIGPATPSLYPIDVPTMGLIADSAHPLLSCGGDSAPVKYELFEDRLTALRELVRRLSGID